jgi:transcriptional regulator with GAF, ATPase, and Fis domain
VVSATNRDLDAESRTESFRQDLYYRLSVFPIQVPPLRERPEDIEPLVHHFVDLAARKHGRPLVKVTRAQLKKLEGYEWAGNVRELQHVIERAVIMSQGSALDLTGMLPGVRVKARKETAAPIAAGIVSFSELKKLERDSIVTALKQSGGKIYGADGAAELLGVKPTTLASRMKALDISKTANSTR